MKMLLSFSCQLCNCFIYCWIYLAVCTMRPTMGWALPSKIWIARAYSKEDWLKRKKQINLTWGIENIREIPIIDVVCHNPEIQGSDVPVLLSSFVFMITNQKIKKQINQIGMRNILMMFLRLLDQLHGGKPKPPSQLIWRAKGSLSEQRNTSNATVTVKRLPESSLVTEQ